MTGFYPVAIGFLGFVNRCWGSGLGIRIPSSESDEGSSFAVGRIFFFWWTPYFVVCSEDLPKSPPQGYDVGGAGGDYGVV